MYIIDPNLTLPEDIPDGGFFLTDCIFYDDKYEYESELYKKVKCSGDNVIALSMKNNKTRKFKKGTVLARAAFASDLEVGFMEV